MLRLTLLASHSSTNLAIKSIAVLRLFLFLVCFLSNVSVVRFVGMCIKIQWTSGLLIDLLMFRWSAFSAFSARSRSQMWISVNKMMAYSA